VKSRDKKFAYDFCHAQRIDFLLGQPDLMIEVDGNTLALTSKGKRSVEAIRRVHNKFFPTGKMPSF
jgi:hypothetical protein